MPSFREQTNKLYIRDDDDPEREDRHKVIELPSGNKVHLRASDPFGHVRINFDSGPTPEYLAGAYTSFTEAEKALDAHFRMRAMEAEQRLENQRVPKVKLTPRVQTEGRSPDTP